MSGSGGGGSFGSGGSTGDCNIVVTVPLNSPKPAVVAGIKVNDVLDVDLDPSQSTVVAKTKGGATAGSLTPPQLADLIDCLKKGKKYKATVLKVKNGLVEVEIRPK